MRKTIGLILLATSVIPLLLMAGDRPNENISLNYAEIKYSQVPPGKRYVVLKDGKKVTEFKGGQRTTMTADCAQLPCPKSFGADVVCWQCVERKPK